MELLLKHHPGSHQLAETDRLLSEFTARQRDSAYLESLTDSPLVGLIRDWSFEFDWGHAEVLYDDPGKIAAERQRKHLRLAARLQTYTDDIDSELLIFSPYFVPGKEGVDTLARLCRRGVRVRVITNSLASTDVAAVHAGYARYRKRLLGAGVELFEMDQTLTREERKDKKGPRGSSKASLHAKSFVLDRARVFIGSLNLDPRSMVENTEIGIMIESPPMAGDLSAGFERISREASFRLALDGNHLRWYRQAEGESRVFTTEPHTGFWRRFAAGLLRLLPLESQL